MIKTVNAYTIYHLDYWPSILLNKFLLKNCLLGATNIVKNRDKSKYIYSSHGIAFSEASSWSFGNDFSGNVVILGVDNSSSSHTDNHTNNF